AAIISGLHFSRDLWAVGITPVPKQFPGTQPSWVQIGQAAAWRATLRRFHHLVRHEHALKVQPRSRGKQNGERKCELWSRVQAHCSLFLRIAVLYEPRTIRQNTELAAINNRAFMVSRGIIVSTSEYLPHARFSGFD